MQIMPLFLTLGKVFLEATAFSVHSHSDTKFGFQNPDFTFIVSPSREHTTRLKRLYDRQTIFTGRQTSEGPYKAPSTLFSIFQIVVGEFDQQCLIFNCIIYFQLLNSKRAL